jgi:hypothetical protein
VGDNRVPGREDNPNFNNGFQRSRSRSPQTGEQQYSDADCDELSLVDPRMGHTSKFEAASNQQGKGCGYAQEQKPSTWPTPRKHRKQTLQVFSRRTVI